MKLYFLSVIKLLDGYGYYDTKVVIAKNETETRKLSNRYVGEEGKIWEDKSLVACERINYWNRTMLDEKLD